MNNGWSAFLRRVFSLTLPIVLQNFINMAVSSADVIMLTYVGQNALSAASLAGEVQFVLSVVFFGLNSGASVLAAQYWGKGDKTTVEKVLGMAVRYSMVIAVVFALVTFCFPAFLMGLFTNEAALIEEGEKYLRIVSISYLFSGFSMMYLMVMRSVERVKLSTGIYTVSLVVNVLLNSLFIFGLFGLPKLGIVGVATATTLARLTEFAICAVDSRRNPIIRFRLKYAIKAANPLLQKDFW
ncbi:MAG: polysaccharide biosynthesis C-terminal domain-containing protein, partial [Clostridia bacterium]|nr:polysaccharide biosynthesis C-terminal domain-containing protein [Clostridia bacterium]